MQIKPQWNTATHPSEWLKLSTDWQDQMLVIKVVEQLEFSYTAVSAISWHNNSGKKFGNFT